LDAICEHLEAVSAGRIKRLLINMPPRCGKSTLVSVLWPAWETAKRPSGRWLFASHAQPLTERDAVRWRRLLESAWYTARWPSVKFSDDVNSKARMETTAGGARLAMGVSGAVTGEGGDRLVLDDPHNVQSIESDIVRQAVVDWFESVWVTRQNDPATSAFVVIGQRAHQRDLSGYLLQQTGWEHLCIRMEYEPDEHVTSIGWHDPRQTEGAPLWAERFDAAFLQEAKTRPYTFAGQYQQRPSPAGGGLLKREWWRFWQSLPSFDRYVISMDPSFRKSIRSDPTCVQVWGLRGPDRYLIRQVNRVMNFTEAVQVLKQLAGDYPGTTMKLVEGRANGDAIVDVLGREVGGIVVFEPQGSKEERVASVSPLIEAGNVFIPDLSLQPWVRGFIEECTAFPNSYHDDVVDAMTQLLIKTSKEQPRVIRPDVLAAAFEAGRNIPPLFGEQSIFAARRDP
jgi:predicted phage terminase large subunit-like protein